MWIYLRFESISPGIVKASIRKIGNRDARRGSVSPKHDLSLCKQCMTIGLNRTHIDHTPEGENMENLEKYDRPRTAKDNIWI